MVKKDYLQAGIIFISACIFFLVLVFFLLPLSAAFAPLFLGNSFFQEVHFYYLGKIIAFTFAQSIISTLLALVVGLVAAFFVSQRNFFARSFLLSLSSIPLCLPALIVALGYISTFGMAGTLNSILIKVFNLKEAPLRFLYSFWGVVICQGFYNFPLVMATVCDAWEKLDKDQADSARLLGASEKRVFFTVTLYQLLPSVVSACIPVFIYCFFSFVIVTLFASTGGTSLEVAIYHAARSSLNFKEVGFLSFVECLCVFIILLFYSYLEKKSLLNRGLSFSFINACTRKGVRGKDLFFFIPFAFMIFLFFLLPLFSILLSSCTSVFQGKNHLSVKPWINLFKSKGFFSALSYTFITSLASSFLCCISGSFYAIFLRIKKYKGHLYNGGLLLKTLPLLPMTLSSVVMAVGLSRLFSRGNILYFILAKSALSWPFAFRQIYSALEKIPDSQIDCAILFSNKRCHLIFKILLPQVKSNLLSSLGFCFALCAGESTLPYVLSLPHFDTLALKTFRLASSYRLSESCAAGLLLALICMLIFFIADRIKEKRI